MTSLTMGNDGAFTLPTANQERCGMLPETPVKLTETGRGVLTVPLTSAPMSEELAQELQGWQALGQETWAQFPYEDEES